MVVEALKVVRDEMRQKNYNFHPIDYRTPENNPQCPASPPPPAPQFLYETKRRGGGGVRALRIILALTFLRNELIVKL